MLNALTTYENNITTAKAHRTAMKTSGGVWVPERPMIGTKRSNTPIVMYAQNRRGISIARRYIKTNFPRYWSTVLDAKKFSHTRTRTVNGKITRRSGRCADARR